MNLIILLPKLDFSGPVKGGLAIAKLLSKDHKVIIISLKGKLIVKENQYEDIKFISLDNDKNFIQKILKLRQLIKTQNNNKRKNSILISICFSSDLISIFAYDLLPRISSIRGNLFKNYFYTYNLPGYFLANLHLNFMRFQNRVIVMNNNMKKQVSFYTRKKITIIPNFINEEELSKYFIPNIDKSKPIKYVFVGSLNKRKNPLLVLNVFSRILKKINSTLHFVGDGPLYKKIHYLVKNDNLQKKVFMHGFQENPYAFMNNSDLLIIPSFSEGTSRAAMEALFLGVPIVMRNVDSNNELIKPEYNNGKLFNNDDELESIMISEGLKSINRGKRFNLLPEKYRQINIKNQYLNLLKEVT